MLMCVSLIGEISIIYLTFYYNAVRHRGSIYLAGVYLGVGGMMGMTMGKCLYRPLTHLDVIISGQDSA